MSLRDWIKNEPPKKLTREMLDKAMAAVLKRGAEPPFRVR